jgi:hypothetical protein
VLKNLLATKVLRQGDGVVDSRRKERLIGVTGSGRTSLALSLTGSERTMTRCKTPVWQLLCVSWQKRCNKAMCRRFLLSFVFVLLCLFGPMREAEGGIHASI